MLLRERQQQQDHQRTAPQRYGGSQAQIPLRFPLNFPNPPKHTINPPSIYPYSVQYHNSVIPPVCQVV